MKSIHIPIFSLILAATGATALAGNGETNHSFLLNISFVQVKDQFNYGLSFSGMNLEGDYELQYSTTRLDLSYGTELGMGAVHNKGVGILLGLKPLDGFAGFRLINDPGCKLSLGPYLSASYMWQLYPELQSGHLFWFSSYELGPRLRTTIRLKRWEFRISVISAR